MTDASLVELGPVDSVVVEFPAGASSFTGEFHHRNDVVPTLACTSPGCPSSAPAPGNRANLVTINAELPENATRTGRPVAANGG